MGTLDTFIVYKALRILMTPWDELPAFQEGFIDAQGRIKKQLTEDHPAYTLFHRVLFKIKRLMENLGPSCRLGRYAATLYPLWEQIASEEGILILERGIMSYLREHNAVRPDYLREQYIPEEFLEEGTYECLNTILDCNGELVEAGTKLIATEDAAPLARVLGVDVYHLRVADTGQPVVVCNEDIRDISQAKYKTV